MLFSLAVSGLSLATITACASPTPGASGPADTAQPADTNAEALRMPAAGEYAALSDPSYGYLKGATGAPGQGESSPDFELPTHTGETFKLSEALAEGPVLLMFYRGFW